MKQWWLNLSLREQQTVGIGGIATIILLVYISVWLPLDNKIMSMRHKVQQNQQLLAWMQAADKQLQESNRMSSMSTHLPASLLSTAQKQIKQSSIAKQLSQLRQSDSDSVQLSFKQVDFDKLITWLTDSWHQQGLTLSQFTIAPSETPGIVSADIQLKSI
jgi:type II secretory pathway component PulM